MKKIDPTTWCSENNQAAKELSNILERICDEHLTRKVSVYFHRYSDSIKALQSLDKKPRMFFLQLLLKHANSEIEKNFTNAEVKSFMKNIIKAKHRAEIIKL
jgi:hypothetical protein